MFHFLIFLLILGVVILLSVIFGVFGFIRMLFRGPRQRQAQHPYSGTDPFGQTSGNTRKGKVISDQEGEYVDYEEIK
ncbi:MAG: hypothetical protein BGP01_12465 [Paludibacter sp. 47-17]|jgi:hypothetical protein|nr:MAG: hypothetical protein ABS72_02365 [Paludibacter sp. SCN 50-10]ODU61907.1 MAG: hypothetical protein ABT12_00180 [Paludibacter sp. SCN 51-9]OJX91227.1 MAG: hypothetical protein BGP01_12465 [Paludibacter sp. 47-17]